MDGFLAGLLFVVGLVMAVFGWGGRIVIRLPSFLYMGAGGVLIMLVGIAGLVGWI